MSPETVLTPARARRAPDMHGRVDVIREAALRSRRVLGLITLAGAFLGVPAAVIAQDAKSFPNKPVRIIVAASPGGTSDILARSIGQKLTEKWNQQIIVENKPGADSNVGAEIAARSTPNGYTLLLLDVSTLTMGPSLYAKLNYDPRKDFAPVTMIVFSPHALTAHPPLPANSIKELIAFSKANPGKLNFASSSNATRLAATRLNSATGMDMLIVPYKGGASAITAVIAGESNVMMASLLSTLSHIKSGKMKPIGVASARRMEATPQIPTLIEGGVPNFVTGSWQGLLAPAATPPDIVKKINAAVVEILRTPEMKAKLEGEGAEVVADTPEEFAKFLRDETATWSKVVKDAGIKPE
jgi:tripartite-type tricarboxylate transporter receptor subunit TctC